VNQQTLPVVPEAPTGMVAMMERLALNPDLPVEKLEKLLEMQLKVRALESEAAFNAAMTEAQSEMRRVAADANNPQTNSKYASYAALDRALRPIYTKHGFAVSFDEGAAPADHVLALAYVSHAAGHTRTYRKTMPIVTTGIKGNAMMTATHGAAAAGSYAKRYLLKDIFNVAIGEDDTDGNAPKGEPISEKQAADLTALIEEVGADKEKFLAWAGATKVEDIQAKLFQTCVRQLEKKRKGK
jgi:hypothetical protein